MRACPGQVFNTYGEYGNAKLLSCYAFTIPHNIFDSVRLPPLATVAAGAVGSRAVRSCGRWIRSALRGAAGRDGAASDGGAEALTRAARRALRRALAAAERGWVVKARYK
jgi:hypothetical protein